ncbi:poly [ADP-ribose] polymerase tankyrase-1-like [Schistocerca piceifrons]|uniref:poly [ADP-ribose] polymerase tankyrase-1-like n=1 Tax=Schistocerca piceifrons TaxID=274613 RepID=UPI001F5EA604|nr:poly [ADP-ribose] polymerase tankyrase-1-like [Schistocerca piceifrons]
MRPARLLRARPKSGCCGETSCWPLRPGSRVQFGVCRLQPRLLFSSAPAAPAARPPSDSSRTPAAAPAAPAAPAARRSPPPPDSAAVSRLRSVAGSRLLTSPPSGNAVDPGLVQRAARAVVGGWVASTWPVRSLSIAAVRPSEKTAAALAGEPAEYRGQPGRRSALPAARVRHAAAACVCRHGFRRLSLTFDPVSARRSLSQQERGRRLIQAANQGAVEQLRELLAAGADVGARGQGWLGTSCTALHLAADRGHVAAASCLVGAGAEVDARSSWGQWTPLHWAAFNGHAGVVRLLVGASADLNARDRWGRTPLHLAAEGGRAEAAAELLLVGADRGARDERWRTPLDVARERGKQELVDILTQR